MEEYNFYDSLHFINDNDFKETLINYNLFSKIPGREEILEFIENFYVLEKRYDEEKTSIEKSLKELEFVILEKRFLFNSKILHLRSKHGFDIDFANLTFVKPDFEDFEKEKEFLIFKKKKNSDSDHSLNKAIKAKKNIQKFLDGQ